LAAATEKDYSNYNELLADAPVYFMNHGFYPVDTNVLEYESPFKNQVMMYTRFLSKIDTTGKIALDVGCGRGGGARALSDMFSFKKVYGCDINPDLIRFCKTNHPGVQFDVFSAEALNYPNSSFDFVFNIESSHIYGDINKFYENVHRILKPGGSFFYADLGGEIKQIEKRTDLFENISGKDITDMVAEACMMDSIYFNDLDLDDDIVEYLRVMAEGKHVLYSNRQEDYYSYTMQKMV
jgi:SAM-dependent methyltransferase